ncbi:MAG: hypothetical protein Q9220_003769 [cf. Caloplaca sp. 1 TL-2023]
MYKLLGGLEIRGLGLLAVSKQVRSEAEPIFYGQNTFKFTDMHAVRPFLKARSSVARRCLRHIMVELVLCWGKAGYCRAEWKSAFGYIASRFHIKRLDVKAYHMDQKLRQSVPLESEENNWLRDVSQIQHLDELHLDMWPASAYYIQILARHYRAHGNDDLTINAEIEKLRKWMSGINNVYEKYLQSRMLEKNHQKAIQTTGESTEEGQPS